MIRFSRTLQLPCHYLAIALLYCQMAQAQTADVKGSQDHPLITRYQGSAILGYSQTKFEEFILPLGPASQGRFTKSQTVTGKLTRILYAAPAGRSTIEVFTNYQQAMSQAGFRTLFECGKEMWSIREYGVSVQQGVERRNL